MTEIYYIQNEKQYRKVLVRLAIEKEKDPDSLHDIGICGCNYNTDEYGNCYWDCCEDGCENDTCCLALHKNDADVADHMDIEKIEVEFPLILVITDSYFRDEQVTRIAVKEAKENTKYGYHYGDCWGA